MASDARERMIEGAVRLLAQRGLQATSFSEVLELTKAPRGSIYHHFPGGKDELVSAALELADRRNREQLERMRGRDAPAVVSAFFGLWRALLSHTDYSTGCSVAAVTVAAEGELLDRAGTVFRSWVRLLGELLHEGGIPGEADPASFASLLVAASEGAVIMCRAERDIAPLDRAEEQLVAQAARLAGVGPGRIPDSGGFTDPRAGSGPDAEAAPGSPA